MAGLLAGLAYLGVNDATTHTRLNQTADALAAIDGVQGTCQEANSEVHALGA